MSAIATSTSTTATSTENTATATDPPGEMPQDLKDSGWTLKDHVGPNENKFQCVNAGLNKTTNAFLRPQDAIESARTIQKKSESKAGEKTEPVQLDKMPVMAREKRPLLVPLTSAEIEVKLQTWKDLDEEHAAIEREAKEVANGYKGQAAQIAAKSAHIQTTLKARAEERDVETEYRADYPNSTVHLVRLDTGVVYGTRPMTQEELKQGQHRLPIV